jgi:D-hexose-6-phosphate mutarotase
MYLIGKPKHLKLFGNKLTKWQKKDRENQLWFSMLEED